MKVFAQIRKVDEAKRLVFGRLAQETVDKADEVMDYASSKPYFEKWSAEISADTDGKSVGNLRAMHGKVAAGKFTQIDFNDEEKAIDVCAKVVDDNEWKKVLEGVYTGFSIGGSYVGEKKVEKVEGRNVSRYTAKPNEGSLVDRPCVPTAKFFEVQKADGSLAKVEFAAPAEPEPIDVRGTPEQVIELGKLMNEGGLELADVLKAMPDFIAAKKKGKDKKDGEAAADDDKPKEGADAKKAEGAADLAKVEIATLRKNFYTCAELAQTLQCLQNLRSSAAWSAYYEGDQSPIPKRIDAVIALAAQVLKEMIDEEVAELQAAGGDASLALAEQAAGLAKFEGDPLVELLKVGARNSAGDKDRIAKIHGLVVELGHECAPAEKLAKVEPGAALQKIVADAVAPLQKALDDAATLAKAQGAEIDKLKAQPAPARVSLRAVAKADDIVDSNTPPLAKAAPIVDDMGEQHEAAGLIKSLHARGGVALTLPQALRI